MILLPLTLEPWPLAPKGWVWEIIHTPALTPLFCRCACECAKSFQLRPTLFDPLDYSHPGFSVHGILQARIPKWVAVLSSRRSFWPRAWTLCLLHLLHCWRILCHHNHLGSPFAVGINSERSRSWDSGIWITEARDISLPHPLHGLALKTRLHVAQ